MGSPKKNHNKGFFATMSSGLSTFGNALHRSVNGLLGYEGLEVINPEGGKEDGEEEAQKGRWKQEERDSYWKMMQKYIGCDVTSMVTLPVLIFEPMTMLQKMAELMEYSHLLDKADECEDPYMRLVYAMQHLGQYQSTMLTNVHGNRLTQFLGRLMKWSTMVASHLFPNRSAIILQ